MELIKEDSWFGSWTWKTVGWASICFLLIACVNGLMSYLFDVVLFETQLVYVYHYFSIVFYTLILYFFYVKFKTNWFGIFSFGISGLIGIPIELWLEFYRTPSLKSPWGAVGWGLIYILYGLSADLSLLLLKTMKNETIAILLSSLIFSTFIILITILPLETFYVPGPVGGKD
ncbi:MAG: hypothetical protein ACXABK_07125, partial [Candidatus Heimdallarchaeaceae archaeon]